jgi:perosamine synthetase
MDNIEGTRLNITMKAPWAIFPRKRLDITITDMLYGLQQCVLPDTESRRSAVEDDIADIWGELTSTKSVMTCLSVRTALDVFLSTINLPAGSEVIMSAVCIKDMVKVVQLHGLVPVAVDLHDGKLEIMEDSLKKAFTEKTKVVIISHIFGAVPPMNAAISLAQENNCYVFEDCAECFTGPAGYKGHPQSDITAFSFGTIKTSTALGGSVMLFADSDLRDQVVEKYMQYPTRPVSDIASRLTKYLVLHNVMRPDFYGALVRSWTSLTGRKSFDNTVTKLSRGFPGSDILGMIRYRPSTALLSLMLRQFKQFDQSKLEARMQKCEELRKMIDASKLDGVYIPGENAVYHSYWLFPVCYKGNKENLCDEMLQRGFDVTATATQLGAIDQYMTDYAEHQKDLSPNVMREMLQNVMYLPVTADMPMWVLRKMGNSFIESVREAEGGNDDDIDDDDWDDDDDFDDDDWNDEDNEDEKPRSKL